LPPARSTIAPSRASLSGRSREAAAASRLTGQDGQPPGLGERVDDRAEQLDRRRIEPVRVVDDEQTGGTAQHADDELGARGGNRRGLDRQRCLGRFQRHAEHRPDQGGKVAERLGDRVDVVGAGSAHRRAQRRREDAERHHARRQLAPDPDPWRRRRGEERLEHPGLAHARRAHHVDHRTRARPEGRQRVPQRRQLDSPADQRPRRRPTALAREATDRGGADGLAASLHRQFLLGTGVVPFTEPLDDVHARQDRPDVRFLGQPCCGDGREAGDGVGPPAHVADLSHERRAAVDPDRHPSAEASVDDPAGGGDHPQLVVVALLVHPTCDHDRGAVDSDVGLHAAHIERLARFADTRAGLPEHVGARRRRQAVEVADADERHDHLAVGLGGVTGEQPCPEGGREVALRGVGRSWREDVGRHRWRRRRAAATGGDEPLAVAQCPAAALVDRVRREGVDADLAGPGVRLQAHRAGDRRAGEEQGGLRPVADDHVRRSGRDPHLHRHAHATERSLQGHQLPQRPQHRDRAVDGPAGVVLAEKRQEQRVAAEEQHVAAERREGVDQPGEEAVHRRAQDLGTEPPCLGETLGQRGEADHVGRHERPLDRAPSRLDTAIEESREVREHGQRSLVPSTLSGRRSPRCIMVSGACCRGERSATH
jgi:hypothetical protein